LPSALPITCGKGRWVALKTCFEYTKRRQLKKRQFQGLIGLGWFKGFLMPRQRGGDDTFNTKDNNKRAY
jgi:hypothetical protein